MRIRYLMFVIFCFLLLNNSILAQNLSKWQEKIAQKVKQKDAIESQIDSLKFVHQLIVSEYESAKKNTADRKSEYDRTKDAYDRGSKNVDIIAPEDLVALLKAYKDADADLTNAKDEEKRLSGEKKKLENDIARLEKLKTEKEAEILGIKADMFDEEISKPVWEEGYGESILAEDKSMKECRKLALDYAKRDAMEKGGKMIMESVTNIEDFRLIKDVIKTTATVKIIEQDNSGDYGKAIRVDHGDMIKFTAKVRLRMQNADNYNPYREKTKELRLNLAGSEYFCDNFDSAQPDTNMWSLFPGMVMEQKNSVVRMLDKSNLATYAQYVTKKGVAPQDFWLSIDVKMDKNSHGNVHLGIHNHFDYNSSKHRQFLALGERWESGSGVWKVVVENSSNKPENWYLPPKTNKPSNFDGTEHKQFHTLKIVYDNSSKAASGYIDDIFLGEDVLDCDMTEGIMIFFSVWVGEGKNKYVGYTFDNFQSNIPIDKFTLEHVKDPLDGKVVAFTSVHSSMALDVSNFSKTQGGNVHQWTWHGKNNQRWKLTKIGDYFQIQSVNSGLVLDVSGGVLNDGGNIFQWVWHGGPSQLWKIEKVNSYYRIINKNSGKSLDVAGYSKGKGGNIQQFAWHGGNNQLWVITVL